MYYARDCKPRIGLLPTIFDESLSYYETICRLMAKTNELVETVNNLTIDVLGQANRYADAKVEEALGEVNGAVASILRVRDELYNDYNEFVRQTNNQMLIFSSRLNGFDAEIDNAVVGVNARTDFAIKQNNDYLLSQLSKGLVDVKVINFFTGQPVSVQSMFDYLAILHLDGGITYDGIIAKNITYSELISKDISYTDLVLHGTTLL